MPIKGLSENRRLIRIGKIHLGIKVKNEKGVEYPKATDYFVCPPEVREVYGEQPDRLDIIIPVEDDELWCSQYYRQYSMTRGLVCLSDDTEILTSNGWRGIDALAEGELAFTMNIQTGMFSEQPVTKKVIFPYEGEMLHFQTRSLDALLTPDHRVVYRWNRIRWRIAVASETPKSGMRWPVAGAISKPDMEIDK